MRMILGLTLQSKFILIIQLNKTKKIYNFTTAASNSWSPFLFPTF